MHESVIVIPARLKSTRFPNKMLAPLAGRSVIQYSYQAACKVADVKAVYVTTDSEEIADNVRQIGADVIMTDETLRNGTERVAQALKKLPKQLDLVINFQGAAPLTPHWYVEKLNQAALRDQDADMLTPVVRCSPQTLTSFLNDRSHGRVGGTTTVFDNRNRALYFSKEVIPYGTSTASEPVAVYHHVGLYAYRPKALRRYISLPQGQLEGLEQLRFLENGMRVTTVEVDPKGFEFWEINNPQDITIVEEMIERNGDPKWTMRRMSI